MSASLRMARIRASAAGRRASSKGPEASTFSTPRRRFAQWPARSRYPAAPRHCSMVHPRRPRRLTGWQYGTRGWRYGRDLDILVRGKYHSGQAVSQHEYGWSSAGPLESQLAPPRFARLLPRRQRCPEDHWIRPVALSRSVRDFCTHVTRGCRSGRGQKALPRLAGRRGHGGRQLPGSKLWAASLCP